MDALMHLGRAGMSSGGDKTAPRRTVRVEVLARPDCPCRKLTIAIVERAVLETGVQARVEIVDITNEPQAEWRRFLGSPTVRVDGRDVEPEMNGSDDYSLASRVYRTEHGLAGWPDALWIREALVRSAAIALVPTS
jgi:hypothetical protein